MPDFDIAILITKNNFNFVWMQHCAVDLNSWVVILPLESFSFEIKGFECPVFTSCEEPLVVLLEVHGNHVSSVAIERSLLIWVSQIIDLYVTVCARSKIFLILTEYKSVDGILSKLLWLIALATFDIPEFDLLVVSCCGKNYLVLLLIHSFLYFRKIL